MLDKVTLGKLRIDLSHPDPSVRAQSVDALAAVRDDIGLRRALRSSDRYVRQRALQALGCELRDRLGWRLMRATYDVDPAVRAAAADITARTTGWISLCLLHRLARDAVLQVRHHAALALAQRGGRGAHHILRRRAARESDPGLRDTFAILVERSRH